MIWLFWVSAGLALYTYAVYPLLLVLLASLHQLWGDLRFAASRGNRRRAFSEARPSVSLLFAAYNEEAVIVQKMENCRAIEYLPDKLEILVGCDGCSDRTAELARAAAVPGARVFDEGPFAQRSGKPEVLNRLVKEARGELVVFSDANTMLNPGAVSLLARHFTDPRIGCVCGELRLVSPDGSPKPEGLYWRYEVFLKFLESRLNLLLGANGGVYAIRRELFTPLPKQAIIDDFLVAMRIRDAGHCVIYDPEAVAYEEAAAGVPEEFRRRIRIGAGNYHALRFTARLLSPTAGAVFFSYWSHKVIRWLVPFALPVAFVSAVALALQGEDGGDGRLFYAACALAGAMLAVLGVIGYRLELKNVHRSLFSVPYYFLSMNLALFLGFVRFVSGSQTAVWLRTPREKQAP